MIWLVKRIHTFQIKALMETNLSELYVKQWLCHILFVCVLCVVRFIGILSPTTTGLVFLQIFAIFFSTNTKKPRVKTFFRVYISLGLHDKAYINLRKNGFWCNLIFVCVN